MDFVTQVAGVGQLKSAEQQAMRYWLVGLGLKKAFPSIADYMAVII
jgi:hypothetical protein